jgi:hypothetical protein
MKGTNFDRRISKPTAMDLIKPIDLPGRGRSLKDEMNIAIMCKEYGDDDDWVGIEADDYEMVSTSPEYQTFEIWFTK